MCYTNFIKFVLLWTTSLAIFPHVYGSKINFTPNKIILVASDYYDLEFISEILEDMNFELSGSAISGSGTVKDYNYVLGHLASALRQAENNTIIVIINSVQLATSVSLEYFHNISLMGYDNATVDCNFNSIECKTCNNIIMENVQWVTCGGRGVIHYQQFPSASHFYNFNDFFFNVYYHGIKMISCTQIFISNCSFFASLVWLKEVSGTVYIDQVHFMSIPYSDETLTSLRVATGLMINQTAVGYSILEVKITNSLFSEYEEDIQKTLLFFYVFVDDHRSTLKMFINQTNFTGASYNPGWEAANGMVWIKIPSCREAYVNLNKVNFKLNNLRTTLLSIDISTFDISRSVGKVKVESCSFSNNEVNRIIYCKGDMLLQVMDTEFRNNAVDSALFVDSKDDVNALFITTAINVFQSDFLNNMGGNLISINGPHILTTFSDLEIINNTLFSKFLSLFLFQGYQILVVNISNVIYDFNNIKDEGNGFYFESAEVKDFRLAHFAEPGFEVCIPAPYNFMVNLQQTTSHTYYHNIQCFPRVLQSLSLVNATFNNNIGGVHGAAMYFSIPLHESHVDTVYMISACTFNNNQGYESFIYGTANSVSTVKLMIKDSYFANNDGTVFYIANQTVQFLNERRPTIFESNTAENGAAFYLALNSKIIFSNNSVVTFSRNFARRRGGAIYYDISRSSNACYHNYSTFAIEDSSTSSLEFKNNAAGVSGNSVYFSVSQSCSNTLPYNTSNGILNGSEDITTSPSRLKLYFPAKLINETDPSTYIISEIMLGQQLIIPACVVDHYDIPTGSVQFTVELVKSLNQSYSMEGDSIILVNCKTLQGITNLLLSSDSGKLPSINYTTLEIQLTSFYDSRFDWKPITVSLKVNLSACHSGFYYDGDLKQCTCYTTDNIVTCTGSTSTITNGYWFGEVNEQPSVTVCPNNYCNFDDCEAATGTCKLYPIRARDNQCRVHRSGAACGNCKKGYTLSFDSFDCVSISKCTAGQTAIVATMTFVYWIVVILLVFFVMYFKIGIGYLYGITFFYSIIDILLGHNTQLFSESLYQLVVSLSSVAKLIPQFLGQLCFIKGMSGIDQQFIHYLHPLAISGMLLLISVFARISRRLSFIVSRAVIHAICLLLLLSYTSIASTSLLLLRSIRFAALHKVYSYLSPDIEYFHGRHLIYGIAAIFFGLVIVIGLPLLLSLEPFLNGKINFIRIKPLLDQFQGCYKDKFRCFASYYMIFRLLTLGIVAINSSNVFITLYLLLVTSTIMVLIHIVIWPYVDHYLNLFDTFVLLNMILVISLQVIQTYHGFTSATASVIVFSLVILPLLAFLVMLTYMHIENIKKIATLCISAIKPAKPNEASNEPIEMQQVDHEVIVDQQLRDKSTTVVGVSAKISFQESLLDMIVT